MNRLVTQDSQRNAILGQYEETDRVFLAGKWILNNQEDLLENEMSATQVRLYHPDILKEEPLSVLQIFMNEQYADGCICIPVEMLKATGYFNERLPKKRTFELLLRLAERYTVIGVPATDIDKEQMERIPEEEDDYQVDCYLVAKYSSLLQQNSCFLPVAQALLERAQASKDKDGRIAYLEDMLAKGKKYQWFEAGAAPVLIYYGATYCYNVMNVMLEQLAESLEKQGICVIRYDEQQEGLAGIARFAGRTFRAVIGMQMYLLSIYLKESGCFLHDKIKGPKFNILLDHPFWLKKQLKQVPKEYYVLTHDRNYQKFVNQYYPRVTECYILPPAGGEQEAMDRISERPYSICFIGTYGDYREKCRLIHQADRKSRFLANRFLILLKKNPELTAEAALQRVLREYHLQLSDQQFVEMMYQMGTAVQCIMYYYREKVIRTLVKAGIVVEVWGSSWRKSALSSYPELHIHEDISVNESLAILQQTKISLNIMAWHKDGFTERMANSMLSGALLLTERTYYDEERFRSGEECVMFSLRELERLPKMVKDLLQNNDKRNQIAERGYQYAKKYHTWDKRAKDLLKLIDGRSEWGTE